MDDVCELSMFRMDQILNSFGDIVLNATDALRLHEECDLLSLRIDKAREASLNSSRNELCAFGRSRAVRL